MSAKTKTAMVLVAILLLCGGLAIWQMSGPVEEPVGPHENDSENLPETPTAPGGMADPDDRGGAARPPSAPDGEAAAGPGKSGASSGSARDPGKIGHGVPAPAGVVSGRVLDEETGDPIRGAEVVLVWGGTEQVVSTDENGDYWFPEVHPGAFVLRVTHSDFAPDALSGLWNPEARGIGGLLLSLTRDLSKLGAVEGHVTDPQGQPVEGETLFAKGRDRGEQATTVTDSAGFYRFPHLRPGFWSICRGDAREPTGERTVSLVPGESLRVDFGGLGALRGVLLDEQTREPLEGHRITLVPVDYSTGVERKDAVTGKEGEFTIPDAGLGPRRLWVRHPGFWTEVAEVLLTGGDQEIEVLLPGVVLAGRVFDRASEEPVRANLYLQTPDDGPERRVVAHATPDAEGNYAFRGLPPGTYILTVNYQSYAPVQRELTLPEKEARNLPLESVATGAVRITAKDPAGNPLEGCLVNLCPPGEMQRTLRATKPSPGVYVVQVSVGTHRLVVWRRDLKGVYLDVNARAGETVSREAVLTPK